MARPRAASDEQILAAAEDLAKEVGWQNVYAPTVHTHMNVGGSLSTFSKVIKKWRAEKEAEEGSAETQIAEIVTDRVSIIDDGMAAIVETLKKLSETVNAELDRAVADERRKSERLRADDKAAHDKAMEDLRSRMDAMSIENDALAEEATSETDRADHAEEQAAELQTSLDEAYTKMKALDAEVARIPELEEQVRAAQGKAFQAKEEAQKQIADIKAEAQGQIEKAEAREAKALKDVETRDGKIESIEKSLSHVKEDLATARSDLTNARAERANADEKLNAANEEIAILKKEIETEKTRADRAWDRVQDLEKKLPAQIAPAKDPEK